MPQHPSGVYDAITGSKAYKRTASAITIARYGIQKPCLISVSIPLPILCCVYFSICFLIITVEGFEGVGLYLLVRSA